MTNKFDCYFQYYLLQKILFFFLFSIKTTDKLFKESAYINRSLAFLEQTILALSDPTRDYIPYRQSKLTHFLKNSIGGRCQTILIANIWNKNTFLKETVRFR